MNRRPLVIALDFLAFGFTVLSAVIVLLGGFVVRISHVWISFRRPQRALVSLALILLARVILDRRTARFLPSCVNIQRLTAWCGSAVAAQPQGVRGLITDEPPLTNAPAGRWRRTAIASLGIGLALAILLHDQLRQPYSVPDLGDPLFMMWDIGWVKHQIVTDPAHLFDANIFYPEHLTLTRSDPMLLPALLAAPLLALGVHPVVAYNLLLLSSFWFSGIATYLLVERLTGSPRAAFIAGLMYACYSYRFEHYSHLELQMTQWIPLGLLALHLFISTGRWRYAVALGLAGVAQLYSSMYYAVFFLVYATVIGLGLFIIHRPSIRRIVLPIVATAAVVSLATMPLERAFMAAQPLKGDRPISEIEVYSATPADYLRAEQYSALWRHRLLPPASERTLFPGAAPLALGAIGLVPPLSPVRLLYAAGLLVSFESSLGFNGKVYPTLHRWLAPVRGLRVPARFAVMVGLTLSILAGFGARRLLCRCRSPMRAHAAFAALIVLIMIDAWPALALKPAWTEPPEIYEPLKNTPGVVLAEFPMAQNEDANAGFMYFSLWHWRPMLNGYSGFNPESYADLRAEIRRFPNDEAIAALRRRGVTHVTVNCALGQPGCDELIHEMQRARGLRLVMATRWQGRPVQLFTLVEESPMSTTGN